MRTYFIRHTWQLDIDDATRRSLWESHRIAVHYPHGKNGPADSDCESLNPDDYAKAARTAIRLLRELATSSGYVCAQYAGCEDVFLGKVEPNTGIEIVRGAWGGRYGKQGRPAVLKTLRLTKVKRLPALASIPILAGRPRQGTLMRWPSVGKAVAHIVEGTSL